MPEACSCDLAELLYLALGQLLDAKGYMIPVCSEAKVIWRVHKAVAVHNLRCADEQFVSR